MSGTSSTRAHDVARGDFQRCSPAIFQQLDQTSSTSTILFYGVSILVIGGGLGVVLARNVVYSAFALLVAMIGTAGVFLLAFSEFLALVQLLIYGGAIVIVIVFALMLTRIEDFRNLNDNGQWLLAAIISVSLLIVLLLGLFGSPIENNSGSGIPMRYLGKALFTDWAIPFEIASFVLLVALIGTVVLVRGDDEERP